MISTWSYQALPKRNADGSQVLPFLFHERELVPQLAAGVVEMYPVFLAATALSFWQVHETNGAWFLIVLGILLGIVDIFYPQGFFIVNPNESRVLVLFGTYRGTVQTNGFYWTNPFTAKKLVSLRARNLNTETLKVNELHGSPIEIAAIVVWRVKDTAHAMFDVENYIGYVNLQCESALRHMATKYPYDQPEEAGISLRGSLAEVSEELKRELQERLMLAGVEVMEAKLSHLAYAPEIAGVMLRRQQATAVIAARKQIVDGAVGMVELAITKLKEKQVVELDQDRLAAMVSNLMVVLCSEQATQPVVNTGTLYT